ncbi:MAG: hypothetical protein HY314_11940 [Acidobacteria bacterium]|nr:hypothetical protein [Acidobacteriota bacterium]
MMLKRIMALLLSALLVRLNMSAKGQEKDIKLDQDSIRETKAYGMMPPELEVRGV